MKGITRRVGSRFKGLYPKHGRLNILCTQEGDVIDNGTGPDGRYITIQRDDGTIRRMTEDKITPWLGKRPR